MNSRTITTLASIVFLVGCNPSQSNLPGVETLGVHSAHIRLSGVTRVTIVREIDGVRTEWLSKEMTKDGLYVHVQLALPGNKMRIAIAGGAGAVTSGYVEDTFDSHPFAFTAVHADHGPGDYTVLETNDRKLAKQNRIVVVAK